MAKPKRVQNISSTARDHLANERTFLAWVRTGLGVMGLGVVFEKVVSARPGLGVEAISIALLVAGAALTLYAMLRYERVADALDKGEFLIARRMPLLIGIGTVALSLGLALYLILSG